MTTNGERREHSSSILSFDMMRRDERRYKVLRVIVHQVRAGGWPKTHWDLVQKERSHKGLRVIVHQVRAAGRSKTHRDLVHRERRYKVLQVIVHQVRAGG